MEKVNLSSRLDWKINPLVSSLGKKLKEINVLS